jgi:hypothetical protein
VLEIVNFINLDVTNYTYGQNKLLTLRDFKQFTKRFETLKLKLFYFSMKQIEGNQNKVNRKMKDHQEDCTTAREERKRQRKPTTKIRHSDLCNYNRKEKEVINESTRMGTCCN